MRKVGERAFQECSGLQSVSLPISLQIIDDEAFEKCISLSSITIPVGVTEIGSDAFLECTSLTSVELSTALRKIGGSAFAKCPSLRVVKCTSPAAPSISKSTFKNSPCLIYVPKGSGIIYRAHKDWKKMSNLREM